MRIPIQAGGAVVEHGVLRLRSAIRHANQAAALRMTLRMMVGFVGVLWCAIAWGTTYYVSSSAGSDANSGTSSCCALEDSGESECGRRLQPGDSILLRRGDVWNESLVPPAFGNAGSPITFDAYGTGAAPNLTGYYAVPSSAWVLVTGNAWKAPLPAAFIAINFCLFGSIWGQKVAAIVVEPDGTVGFLPGERIPVCVFGRKSGELLHGTDCADGVEQYCR